jgi:amino acid transporter
MTMEDQVTSVHQGAGTGWKDTKDLDSKNPVEGRDIDEEEKHSNGETRQLPNLQRKLKSRHLHMIAMGKSSLYPTIQQ